MAEISYFQALRVEFQKFSFSSTMNPTCKSITISGVNPFDKSYHHLQKQFDNQIINMLFEIMQKNVSLLRNPLVTNLMSYAEDPDTWVLEQIVNGTAEISSSTIILTPWSPVTIDYSYGIGTFRPEFYFKAKSLREKSNIYLLPFSSKLWVCLIMAILLLTMALIFILIREAKLPHKISYDVFARIIDIQEDSDEKWTNNTLNSLEESVILKEKWEIEEILLLCLGALCQQGSARDPSTNAARLLLLVLFILAVVSYTAYSASVISIISLFPSTELREFSLEENFLLDHNKVLTSIQKPEIYLESYYKKSEFVNIEKGFDQILDHELGFIGDHDVSLTVLHKQNYELSLRCSLAKVPLGKKYQRVFPIKNNFTFKGAIDYNILRLKQFGLIDRERSRIFNLRSPCSLTERSSHSNFISFDENDVKPVIHLFMLGVITSVIMVIVENICYYCSTVVQDSVKN